MVQHLANNEKPPFLARLVGALRSLWRPRRYREFEEQTAIIDRHDLNTEQGRAACARELWEAQRESEGTDPQS